MKGVNVELLLMLSPVQKTELPLPCANTIPKIQAEIYPSSPKWRSTFFLLALLLWEMTQGGIQEGGEHSGSGSDVSFLLVPALFQPCSGGRSTQHPQPFTEGSQDWHINAGTKYPVLCPDSSNQDPSPASSTLEEGFLQYFLADRSTAQGREFPFLVCWSSSALQSSLMLSGQPKPSLLLPGI